jgi:replication factor C subunit 1
LAGGGPAPDIEDAFEVDDTPDDVDDETKKDDSEDVTKDSLIKMAKKKKATAGSGGAKGKAKKAS